MLGLGYVILFFLYWLIIKWGVTYVVKWAKRSNRSSIVWGGVAAILMLSIVFWDLIPVYGTHQYQCINNGGFTVYKTLDQWRDENPGVAETLVAVNGKSSVIGDTVRYQLNQRFSWDNTNSQVWYTLYKKEENIVDIKTGEILAKNIDFYTNIKNLMTGRNHKLRDFKVWMKIDSCESGNHYYESMKLNDFLSEIKELGKG